MSTYLFLQRAEDYGAAGMLWFGGEGMTTQREAFERLGCEVIQQYALLGRYDAMVIAEIPDDKTALAVSLYAEEHGFYTEAVRAFSADEMTEARDLLARHLSAQQGSEDG